MFIYLFRDWTLENTTNSITVTVNISLLSDSDMGLYQPRAKVMHPNGSKELLAMTPLLDIRPFDGKEL